MFSFIKRRLEKSPYWRDIAWVVSGNGLAQIITILALPIITRLYTPTDFALQVLFVQITAFITTIITLRYEFFIQLPKKDSDVKNLIYLVILLAITGTIVISPLIWLFRESIANLLGNPALAPWLVIVPLSAAVFSVAIALQHFMQRNREFRLSSLSELASKGTYVGTVLAGYWLFPTPTGLILAHICSSIGKIVFLTRSGKYKIFQKKKLGKLFHFYTTDSGQLIHIAKIYFKLSWSLILSHVMLSITTLFPLIFIAKNYGSHTLGQFALVISTVYLPSGLVGRAIGQVYYQRAAENWNNGKNFIDLWHLTAKKLILIGLLPYAMLAILAPVVYPLIFGSNWAEAGEFARLVAVSGFFSFISSPLDRACLVVGAWWYMPSWHMARAVTTGLVVSVTSHYGLNVMDFVSLLVAQMTILYIVDYWAEWRFATRYPEK